jgi:hypothetical protein
MPGGRRRTMFVNFISANQDLNVGICFKKDARGRRFLDQYAL